MRKTDQRIKFMVVTAMLSALSFVLYLFEFPLLSAFPHLKLNFSDIPALIGGVFFGPLCAILVELIKNILQLITRGLGEQMGFGNIMDFLVGCGYVLPFTILFHKLKKTKLNDIGKFTIPTIAAMIGILLAGLVGNTVVVPLFFKFVMKWNVTAELVRGAVYAAVIFNTIKGAILTAVIIPVIIALRHVKFLAGNT